jgi:hypothetical protein
MSNPLILTKKSGGDFTPHPETDGLVKAVIVDVTAVKKIPGPFGERETFKLVFESELKDESGKPYGIWSMPYTPSLHEKANFRKDLKKILGRDLSEAELNGFNVEEVLLHHPVQVIVKHEVKGDNTYAQISHVQPDKTGSPLQPSGKFVREKDRKQDGSGAAYRKSGTGEEAPDGRTEWQKTKVHLGPHKGLDLSDLDEGAVRELIDQFLPRHQQRVAGALNDRKPTADDGRLAVALEAAIKVLNKPVEPAMDDQPY